MSMAYIRDTYGVPAKRFMRVVVGGRPGVISASRGAYLLVRWDGTVGARAVPCHPTWQVRYLDRDGRQLWPVDAEVAP